MHDGQRIVDEDEDKDVEDDKDDEDDEDDDDDDEEVEVEVDLENLEKSEDLDDCDRCLRSGQGCERPSSRRDQWAKRKTWSRMKRPAVLTVYFVGKSFLKNMKNTGEIMILCTFVNSIYYVSRGFTCTHDHQSVQ